MVQRLCGICPVSHHLAAAKAMDMILTGRMMDAAEAEHEIDRVDPDHRTVPKQLGEDAEREPVVRIVERRHDYGRVADIEVRVAGRQALPDRHLGDSLCGKPQ